MSTDLHHESKNIAIDDGTCESDVDDDHARERTEGSKSRHITSTENQDTLEFENSTILSDNADTEIIKELKDGTKDNCHKIKFSSNEKYSSTSGRNVEDFSGELKSRIQNRGLKNIPKLTLTKHQTPTQPISGAYHGVTERIKALSMYGSLDNDISPSTTNKESHPNESRQLSIDSGNEHKVSNSYRLLSLTSTFGVVCQSPNLDLSNSEIIVEDFSPVSETTKHLEHHLCFSTSPTPLKLSPRIPKLTRFARLNRLLSSNLDPPTDDNSSTVDNDN